jgi:hypothetical protein
VRFSRRTPRWLSRFCTSVDTDARGISSESAAFEKLDASTTRLNTAIA